MNIKANEIEYKKQIGTLEHDPVVEIGMKGGLHLIVAVRKSRTETLGAGPHRAVARHIARKREPKIEITELSKSDDLDLSLFAGVLAKYEDVTDQIQQSWESRETPDQE